MDTKSKEETTWRMILLDYKKNVTESNLNIKIGEVKAQWELLSDAKLVDLSLRSKFFPKIRRLMI